MREHKRLIRFDGADGEFMYFTAPSWTTDEEYTISVDKAKGTIKCTCMGSRCWKKKADLVDFLNGKPCDVCKHLRSWLVAYKELLELP